MRRVDSRRPPAPPRGLPFLLLAAALAAGAVVAVPAVVALDPPHDESLTDPPDPCANCHMLHQAVGGAITRASGNANLCLDCHSAGKSGEGKPFVDADQALPGTSGNSHRWDSGASGWVKVGTPNSSTGTVTSGGVFTGRYAKRYTITIAASPGNGDVGTAKFNWTATSPGGGSGTGITTGTNVALDQGVTVTFANGTNPSFKAGDVWYVYVRADIRQPTSPGLAARVSGGKIMCSTCHNQHSQQAAVFDGAAPTYPPTPTAGAGPTPTPAGGGRGRHFMRIDNDLNQMCLDCHNVRNVSSAAGGSHPVGVVIPASGQYKTPIPSPTPVP